MEDLFATLRQKIDELETQLDAELDARRKQFHYHLEKRRVWFEAEVRAANKRLKTGLLRYIAEAPILMIVTAPVIYALAIPFFVLDVMVSVYQAICFPVYKIKKVPRADFIVIDRQHLDYLNGIEKFNCMYCGYANGVVAYVREVAGRTEKRFCPIKHASRTKGPHQRYYDFIDYGDAKAYRELMDKREGRDANGNGNQ